MSDVGDLAPQESDTVVANPAPQPSASSVWTLEQLREGTPYWSLASDCGLLNYLKAFSNSLDAKTRALQSEADTLNYEAQSTSIRLQNTFNSFIQLSTAQFVENRVYDDDEKAATNEATSPPPAPVEMTQEEGEAYLLPKYTTAILEGTKAMTLYMTQSEDSEQQQAEDDAAQAPETVATLTTNFWNRRPLPFLINSPQFIQDDFCGLYYEEDEDDSLYDMSSDPLNLSEAGDSLEDPDADYMSNISDVNQFEDEMESEVPAPKKTRKPKKSETKHGDLYDASPDLSEEYLSENGYEGSELAVDDEIQEIGSDADHRVNQELDADDPRAALRMQLEAALGGGPKKRSTKKRATIDQEESVADQQDIEQNNNDIEDDIPADSKEAETEPIAQAPSVQKPSSIFDDDEEEERDIFASTAPKSRYANVSAGLFDTEESDLFSGVAVPTAKPTSTTSAPKTKPTSSKKTSSSNFFEDPEDEQEPAAAEIIVPKPAATTAAPPKAKKAVSLFDSDDEQVDLFASTAPSSKTATIPKVSTTKPISTDDDMDFLTLAAQSAHAQATKTTEKKTTAKKPASAPTAAPTTTKKPSLYDTESQEDDPIFGSKTTSTKPTTETTEDSSVSADTDSEKTDLPASTSFKPFGGVSVLPTPGSVTLKSTKKKTSFFETEDEEDSLLGSVPVSKPPTKSTAAITKTSTTKKDKTSFFDEEETLDFKPTPVVSTKPAPKKSIFDDGEDILGSLEPSKPAPKPSEPAPAAAAATTTTSTTKAKKSLFEDEGEFFSGLSSKPAPKAVSVADSFKSSIVDSSSAKAEPSANNPEPVIPTTTEHAPDSTKTSTTTSSRIASLQQNLNLNVGKMLPTATRPKVTRDESENDDFSDEEDQKVESSTSQTTSHTTQTFVTPGTSSDNPTTQGALLSDPNLTRARPSSNRRLPTRRPGSGPSTTVTTTNSTTLNIPVVRSDTSPIETTEPKRSTLQKPKEPVSIFDESPQVSIQKGSTSIFDSAIKPSKSEESDLLISVPQSKPTTASVFESSEAGHLTATAGKQPSTDTKPGSGKVTTNVTSASSGLSGSSTKAASSIFDDGPAIATTTKPNKPASTATSIFDTPAPSLTHTSTKAPVTSIFDDPPVVTKPATTTSAAPKPTAASIFDTPIQIAPVTKPAEEISATKPSVTAASAKPQTISIFDESPVAQPTKPSVPAATAGASSAKPVTPSIFDTPTVAQTAKPTVSSPNVQKPGVIDIFADTPKPTAAASIFDDAPKPAKPESKKVASIFD